MDISQDIGITLRRLIRFKEEEFYFASENEKFKESMNIRFIFKIFLI